MRNSYNKPELKSLYYEEEVEKKFHHLMEKTMRLATSGTGFIVKTIAEKGSRTLLLNRKTNRSNRSYDLLKEHSQS